MAPVPHSRIRRTPGGQRPQPTPASYVERGVAVETIQGILGQMLLVLAALAVVLFALILVLMEANYVLRLGRELARRWKSDGLDSDSSDLPTANTHDAQCPREERAVR